MNSWLSQKSHSWSIVAPFQWPIVTIVSRNDLPVGATLFPSPVDIGREIVDVPSHATRLMTIWPGHHNVAGMTLGQTVPFLVAKNVEIERVEGRQTRRALIG